MQPYGRSMNTIASVVTVLVVLLIVAAAGIGGYYAFAQTKSTSESISSTIVPETYSSSTLLTSSSSAQSTSLTTTSPSLTSTSDTQSSTISTSTVTSRETSIESLLTSTLTSVSSACTYSTSSSTQSQTGILNVLSGQFPSSLTRDLFGNFSQMSLRLNVHSALNESLFGNSSSVNITELIHGSYSVVGIKIINGTQFTLVNYALSLSMSGAQSSGGGSQNQTGTIYFNPGWNATLIVFGNSTITGALATSTAAELMTFFEISLLYSSLISAAQSDLQIMTEINQTTISLGNVTMDVTNYNVTIPASNSSVTTSNSDSNCGNFSVPQLNSTGYTIIQLGELPGTNTAVVTMVESYFSSPTTGTESSVYQLLSLTLANTTTMKSTSSSSSSATETISSSMTTI
jgi:trimeric autotransporter adhesin